MKRYCDPEIEVVCFDAADVTNFGDGDNPDFPADDLSNTSKSYFPQW